MTTIFCPDCKDKGYIGGFWTFCHCPLGRALRAEAEQVERAQEPVPEGQLPLTWENAGRVEVEDGILPLDR